jgi:predicted ArsR family transcriptional regulator
VPDWAQKLAEAEVLTAEAEQLYQQLLGMRKRAAVLRAQAEREREREAAKPAPRAKADRLLAAAGLALADDEAGLRTEQLADVLEVSTARAQRLLTALEKHGRARREGPWWYAVDPDEKRARDIARELEHFTLSDLAGAMRLTEVGARHWLEQMAHKGIVEPNGAGWVYVKPSGPTPARERRPPAELEAVRRMPPELDVTSGRQVRSTAGVNELTRAARKHGCEVVKTRGGHMLITTPSGAQVRFGSTPSGGALHAARDQLRRAGVPV